MMKLILRKITGNHELMLKVFMYILEKIVASTENQMDDRILGHIEHILGEINIDGLEDEEIEKDV